MKKILSYILISLIVFVNLFAPFSVGIESKNNIKIEQKKTEAADCIINSATWSPAESATLVRPNPLILNLKTTNCEGRTLAVIINETSGFGEKNVSNISGVTLTTSDFSINFNPGEEACGDNQCEINYNIFLRNPDSVWGEVNLKQDTPFIYKCTTSPTKTSCDNNIPWSYTLQAGTKLESDYNFSISPIIQTTDTSAKIDITIKNNDPIGTTIVAGTVVTAKLNVQVDLKNKDGSIKETKKQEMTAAGGVKSFSFDSLDSDTDYIVQISVTESSNISTGMSFSNNERVIATVPAKTIHTNVSGVQTLIDQGPVETLKVTKSVPEDQSMPGCGISNGTAIMGCIAQGFYYILFQPTSYLFALAGTFFDYTFSYSVQDSSYRSSFVVEGWGLVRDFCNMFFIFIMLYVAIGTILNLHSMKTKETIINVVVIGLFINFSLFATQVIIDASNITARVFYNSDSIKITEKGPTGATNVVSETGVGGVIPLSAALVNKINPQNIIIRAKEINKIQNNSTSGLNNVQPAESNGIGVGQFILIVILASAVNIIGFMTFLVIGMVFVSRVIGLWIAMIMAPLAFFTYILPEMSSAKMVGWKNWWPETIKLAFLAPVFIFFMYIILKFLQMDLISDAAGKSGLDFFIAALIPFAFVMILLNKAKSIATDMSGEMGQKITGGIAAAGGMMLGGAALGSAFALRKTLGIGMAAASKTEGAKELSGHRIKFNDEISSWKAHGRNGPKPTWSNYKQQNNVPNNKNPVSWLGAKLNEKQARLNKIDHARHEIDEAKKAAGLEGVDDINMSGEDEKKVQANFNRSKKSDVEASVRRGVGADGKDILTDGYKGEEAWKSGNRDRVVSTMGQDPNNVDPNTGELTDSAKKKVENQLNAEFNIALKGTTDDQLKNIFKHLKDESRENVSILTRGFAKSNKASYDVRNISEVKSDKRDGFFSKVPTAMIAGVALGVRSGIKSSGINHGKGEGDILKDIGSTITEALKGIKVEVPKAPSGGGHGGGDAHGGGGGGHH